MAPSIQPFLRLLFVVLLLGVLPALAAARPCKNLVISSSSISFHPNFPYQNNPISAGTARILTIFTEIRQFNPRPLTFLAATEDQLPLERASRFGLGLGFDPDSLRDSTTDVLSVVVALLFGIGCGAFTAATMYLGWSLFSNRRRYSDLDYDDFEYNDGDMSPKKAGFVKTPPPTADLSLLGDVKILPGDATSAADVKIPLCNAPPDAAPAGDVKIPPSLADAPPAGNVKTPPRPVNASRADVAGALFLQFHVKDLLAPAIRTPLPNIIGRCVVVLASLASSAALPHIIMSPVFSWQMRRYKRHRKISSSIILFFINHAN